MNRRPVRLESGSIASRWPGRGGLLTGFAPALFDRGRYRRERGLELGAETVDHRDDGKRVTCGDQAVLDRGGAGLVTQKAQQFPSGGDELLGHGIDPLSALIGARYGRTAANYDGARPAKGTTE